MVFNYKSTVNFAKYLLISTIPVNKSMCIVTTCKNYITRAKNVDDIAWYAYK